MIHQRTVNGRYTEIYTNGGGETWITEAKATVFHNFWHTKVLAKGESLEDFREVDDAEKAALEKIREEWKRPEQLLIDQWNEAFGKNGQLVYGRYNEATGYFEAYDEIFDINRTEAIRIMNYGIKNFQNKCDYSIIFNDNRKIRTNICPTNRGFVKIESDALFANQSLLEVAAVGLGMYDYGIDTVDANGMFTSCSKLRTIIGVLRISNRSLGTFDLCQELREAKVRLTNVPTLSLASSPLFSFASFQYLVQNSTATATTITVHPSIYAALQGEAESYPFNGGSREEWMQLLEDAAAKNITFASA